MRIAIVCRLLLAVVVTTGGTELASAPQKPLSEATVLCVDDLAFPDVYSAWFDPDSIPARIRELDGTRVRIHGVMFPPPTERLRVFLLIGEARRDGLWIQSNPRDVHTKIGVRLKEEVDFTQDPVVVEGTLHLHIRLDHGALSLLFMIDDAEVRPAPIRPGHCPRIWWGC